MIAEALASTCDVLASAGIWYCLAYGTLLGAVREQQVIAWDTDFDLFIRPFELASILAISSVDVKFAPVRKQAGDLAMGSATTAWFDPGRLAVLVDGRKMGDLFAPVVFSDGVLRQYDLEREIFWAPHSSFPHFFVQELAPTMLAGRTYPGPRHAGRFLAAVYGADWRTPYRAAHQGGTRRTGTTDHGDLYLPKLHEELRWCRERGWDDAAYAGCPRWPRAIRGAGPIGPTPETESNSRTLWYRDLDELSAYY